MPKANHIIGIKYRNNKQSQILPNCHTEIFGMIIVIAILNPNAAVTNIIGIM